MRRAHRNMDHSLVRSKTKIRANIAAKRTLEQNRIVYNVQLLQNEGNRNRFEEKIQEKLKNRRSKDEDIQQDKNGIKLLTSEDKMRVP